MFEKIKREHEIKEINESNKRENETKRIYLNENKIAKRKRKRRG